MRTSGDNRGARAKATEANNKLKEAFAPLDEQSLWHEEAEFEGWAMPSEYVQLGHLYFHSAKLEKMVRLNGAK